jgi:hypothetical protein
VPTATPPTATPPTTTPATMNATTATSTRTTASPSAITPTARPAHAAKLPAAKTPATDPPKITRPHLPPAAVAHPDGEKSQFDHIDVRTPLYPSNENTRHPGVTIYDWLAGVALQGLVTKGMKVQADRAMTEDEKDQEMARRAYKLADAMLLVRSEIQFESK